MSEIGIREAVDNELGSSPEIDPELTNAIWELQGYGPEVKLFLFALLQFNGDVGTAEAHCELKPGQGEVLAELLSYNGWVRMTSSGKLMLCPDVITLASKSNT